MDPHFRTYDGILILNYCTSITYFSGFYLLIEKEFCSFGHRFKSRLGHLEKKENETSPIFLQWIVCRYFRVLLVHLVGLRVANPCSAPDRLRIQRAIPEKHCRYLLFLFIWQLPRQLRAREKRIEEGTAVRLVALSHFLVMQIFLGLAIERKCEKEAPESEIRKKQQSLKTEYEDENNTFMGGALSYLLAFD